MKRRAILLMATMAAALIVAGGVALAETVSRNDTPPCHGTPEGDRIYSSESTTGTETSETVHAYEGNDGVWTLGGNDTVYAGSGNDHAEVSGGSNTVYGGAGRDTIYAGIGDSAGSTDHSYAGRGNDTIEANDGNVDIINCGKGKNDRVYYDVGTDTIKNCEIKNP